MDDRSLCFNNQHNKRLFALGEHLNKRITKIRTTELMTTQTQHILTLNNFNFKGQHFIQIKGCAIGTDVASSYATIYGDKFENMYLNMMHNSIKFDCEKSAHSITVLDTRMHIDKNRRLQTTLHLKPTNIHNYFHYWSSHPNHLKHRLPYSQAIRLRIYSDNSELKKQKT